MLNIIFGHDLDGYETLITSHTCGEVVLGPLGFLDLLEVRLGLRGIVENEPLRTVQYLDCLYQTDDGERFYSQSLRTDEMAVARTLLGWRDTWIEAGWNGQAQVDDSKRIRDVADVELLSKTNLSPGTADRLVAVFNALSKVNLPDIEVELKDHRESFSYLWQAILGQLNTIAEASVCQYAISAPLGTDLALLQQAVLTNQPVKLQGDGTVLFITAYSEGLLARGVANILHEQLIADASSWFKQPLRSSIVDGGNGHCLDLAFSTEDLPITGTSQHSRWRPPLQLLSLTLGLMWTPLDPHRLLEFLTHPVCPLPRFARYKLADTVAEFPGMGGKPWLETLSKLKIRAVERADGDSSAGKKLLDTVDEWLGGEQFDAADGVPIGYVAEKCAKVARWAAAHAERQGVDPGLRSLLFSASAQSSQAQKILSEMASIGRETIGRLQLERLIDQATSQGVAMPEVSAELGHNHLIQSPASVIEDNERLLWWNFCEPTLPRRWPWSSAELRQLVANSAVLPTVESQLQLQAEAWLRPLFAARRQLVLTVPRTSERQAVRQHPLRARLDALTDSSIPTLDIGDLLSSNNDSRLTFRLDQVPHQGLCQPMRWWQLADPALIGLRKTESSSSLQAFIESPYQWLLRYKGQLYPAALASIDDGNRQRGNLLHRFIERLFESNDIDWQSSSQHQLSQWIEAEFHQLLAEEGANYLLPGKLKDRQELAETTQRTVWTLIAHLRSAHVTKVEIEKRVEGSFVGGDLVGYIDMLLTNKKGEELVLDLKWAGGSYRKQEFQDNRSLQLTLYSFLRKEQKRWPAQGYYILSEERLLAENNQFFPNAEVCPLPDGETAASLWLAFEKSWKWRRQQLNDGLIEVTVGGTVADADSLPPNGCLAIDEHNDHFNDFAALTGWKEGA